MSSTTSGLRAPVMRGFPGVNLFRFQRNGVEFMQKLARDYGDVSSFRLGGQHVLFVNHPELVKQVLITNNDCYVKGRVLQRAKRLLGEGLLTSEGEFHKRQRRLAQPAFHRQRIAGYGRVMSDYANRLSESWQDGARLDAGREMNRLTLEIVGKTLFDAEVADESDEIGLAMNDILEMFGYMLLPFAEVLERLPLPAARKFQKARSELDRIIYRIINERRASREDKGDLLSMLMLAHDTEASNESNNQSGMTDEQIRDEALTIFLAGHETTAVWLAWTWHLLTRAPEAERRLHEELDTVLNGRAAQPEDVPKLEYTEKVLLESLRVRPPAYALGRLAIKENRIGEYTVAAKTLVLLSPYVIHHDARYFDCPDEFKPERWTREFRENLPAFAFFPFGGGVRRCIGEGFAWMEATIVLATLAACWRWRAEANTEINLQPRVTLRPKEKMLMRLEKRGGK